MSQKLSDFSPANISAIYRYIGLEITVDAQRWTDRPPASPDDYPKILRTPHRLIDEIVDFKTRHAQACVDRLAAMPGIAVPDPWDQAAEDQLVEHIRAVVGRIRKRIDCTWPVPFPLVDIVQERAEQELRQRISEEFEAGRIAYWAAKNGHTQAAFSNALAAGGNLPGVAAKKKRSTRKIPVDQCLGRLEQQMRQKLKQETASEAALDAAMEQQLYSLSAESLEPLLKRHGCRASSKTIARCEKYKAWRRYRKNSARPAESADLGPVGRDRIVGADGLQISRTEVAVDGVQTGTLSKRSGNFGSAKTRKSKHQAEQDSTADLWAKRRGVDLPAAE